MPVSKQGGILDVLCVNAGLDAWVESYDDRTRAGRVHTVNITVEVSQGSHDDDEPTSAPRSNLVKHVARYWMASILLIIIAMFMRSSTLVFIGIGLFVGGILVSCLGILLGRGRRLV